MKLEDMALEKVEEGIKLKELVNKLAASKLYVDFVGVIETEENGDVKRIQPNYLDEYLETHGEKEVAGYIYQKEIKAWSKLLLVSLK